MLLSNPKKLFLTLFCYTTLVLTLVTSSNAHIQQRDHANLKRLIKKRSPSPQGGTSLTAGPVAGAGAAVPTFPPASSGSASNSVPTSAASSASESSSVSQQTSSSSQSVSLSESDASSSLSTTSSPTSETTSATESSSSSTATSEPLNITGAPNPTAPVAKPTVTRTESVNAEQSTTPSPLAQSGAAKPKSKTVTVLIIVASSVAGIAILWTIFRKWKLGRSSKFDERLQPINWQPTNDDGDLPGLHRRLSGASSFRSGSGHPTSARGNGGSDHGHNSPSSYAIPDHDFTAGPATLAPVGGYADLARGPSPQPQMNQMSQGASMARPAYDVGLPLHHQGGYGTQDTYDYGGSKRY